MDIAIIWALIILFATVMYTIFDGFDLGVGILLSFVKEEENRDIMVDTITPVWDGNESWIVLAGVGLFGGFPIAYSILLPALYIPLIIMVISMILRGISMEFRFLAIRNKLFWDALFSGGSFLAAFCQGMILANVIEGIQPRLKGTTSMADPFYFMTPFTLCTGLLVVCLYALLGSSWLNFKTEEVLQHRFKRMGRKLLITLAILFTLICWLRTHLESFAPRFTYHGEFHLFHVSPLIWIAGVLLFLTILFLALRGRNDSRPFAINILMMVYLAIFVAAYIWPYIVPPFVDLHHAGSPWYGNRILLISALIIIPVILSYLCYSYFVFRGKTISENNYDPVWTEDLSDLHHHGRQENEKAAPPVQLGWPVRLLLVVFWLMVFFVVLGFLGDQTAIITIGLMILAFVIAWYRKARNEHPADE